MPFKAQPTKLSSGEHLGRLTTAHLFAVFALTSVALFEWPLRWLLSGAPLLTYSILLGATNGHRILPVFSTWTLLTTLNLVYAVSATSWLLYWFFVAGCYPMLFISCIFQFDVVADFVRRRLRAVLRGIQFTNDKVAFFDLPALEIDTDVDGLLVIRGLTVSLSSLTVIAHGVEVGIKLSDDLEIAIQVEQVKVSQTCLVEHTFSVTHTFPRSHSSVGSK